MQKTSDIDAMTTLTVSRDGLTREELAHELQLLGKRWSVVSGELRLELLGTMAKTGMVAAFAGALAEEINHHPRILLEYAGLRLMVHTQDATTVTVMDLVYAARLEQWLRSNTWPEKR
ncbi:MAG: 4a-hydroxytetrahydrobiopterin dehydratase [Deltaproteobacteria bacterium]|nr:4a-hydroxytetrahydrobiopterin dehydratase [Deltaproteobacteria bacterium]